MKNGVNWVAVFGVVRRLHSTAGSSSTQLPTACSSGARSRFLSPPLIEAGCPDLSMRDNYRFGGDDFDDPTTNVQQRRALAITKPISEGY